MEGDAWRENQAGEKAQGVSMKKGTIMERLLVKRDNRIMLWMMSMGIAVLVASAFGSMPVLIVLGILTVGVAWKI